MNQVIWNTDIAADTARILLDTGSYLINFDKPKSDWTKLPGGTKVPCYCNCRFIGAHPSSYQALATYLETIIRLEFPDAEIVAGLATAGISWAAQIATRLSLPLCYVRSTAKDYGVGKLIECNPPRNVQAVIVDDACFTGDSILKAAASLKEEFGIKTIGVVTVVSLSDWNAENNWHEIAKAGIKILSLTSYHDILKLALNRKMISNDQMAMLQQFYQLPNSFVWPDTEL